MSLHRLLSRTVPIACALLLAACGGGGGGGGGTTTTPNNAVAAASKSTAQAVIGGTTPVTISFTSDDGKPITNVQVTTNLATLPAGWTASTATFTCSQATTGNGCMLSLSFAPTTVSSGTLTINYSYTDNAGAAKTGTVSITYNSTSANNAVATVAPVSPVTAIAGGPGLPVKVTFTTDDGNPATALAITGPATLPAGWSGSTSTFACTTFSTSNGCQLALTYQPAAAGSGTLALTYSYKSGSGVAKTGSVNIAYSATAAGTVVGTNTPPGQIAVVAGGAALPVKITFNTNAPSPATNLTVTSGLTGMTPLPAGWTGPATFACPTVTNAGTACQLSLSYAPLAAATGTVTIGYGYTDNAGVAQTGTASVSYVATANNNVNGVAAPLAVAVSTYTTTPVTVTFNTDDANPATLLSVTPADLTTLLPAGWTAPATFACATVASTGTACQLALTFAPKATSSDIVTLHFAYTSNSGAPKTGMVQINYSSSPTHLYVADGDMGGATDTVWRCTISASDGSVTLCGSAFTSPGLDPRAIALNGNYAYVAAEQGGTPAVYVCPVKADGSLDTCVDGAIGTLINDPYALAVNGSYLYIVNRGGAGADPVTVCKISTDGSALSACQATATAITGGGTFLAPWAIAFSGNVAYVADILYDGSVTPTNGSVVSCIVASDGTLGSCALAAAGAGTAGAILTNNNPTALAINGTSLFIGTSHVGSVSCTIGIGGALGPCANTGPASSAYGIAFANGFAYAAAHNDGKLKFCTQATAATIDTCTDASGLPFSNPVGLTPN